MKIVRKAEYLHKYYDLFRQKGTYNSSNSTLAIHFPPSSGPTSTTSNRAAVGRLEGEIYVKLGLY